MARPIFDRRLEGLFYGIRHPDTGEWLTAVYRVIGGETGLIDGWQYEWEYPALPEQPDLEPDRAYVLVMLAAETLPGDPQTVRALVPVYEPGSLWERVIRAMDPARWAQGVRAVGDRRVCTGLCALCWSGRAARSPRTAPGADGHGRHHHRDPGAPDLRSRACQAGLDRRLGDCVRGAGGGAGLDGPDDDRRRAPGEAAGGVARAGAAPRAGPCGRGDVAGGGARW